MTLSKFDAVAIAARHIEAAGFEADALSNQSEARYYRHPGRDGLLRVAAHSCRHGFDIVTTLTFEYSQSWQRDENDIALCEEEIIALADEAMAEYLEEADEAEEEDDDE